MSNEVMKPVILLTFANDLDNHVRYLRHLSEEARRLREALQNAHDGGRCQMEIHQNVTLDEILDAFQRLRNRVAIFHFGGHAGSFGLLVDTSDGHPAMAHAAGLATFLAQQSGLRFVFLNGCSTRAQVQGLLDAGVEVVIATTQWIDDGVASRFAGRFYQGLASGATLKEAYEEAVGATQSAHGDNPRKVYTSEGLDEKEVDTSRWPWEIAVRPGVEEALEWRLPEAAPGPGSGGPEMYIDARKGGQVSIDKAFFSPYIQGAGTGTGAPTEPPQAGLGAAQPMQPEPGSAPEEQEEPATAPEQGRGRRMRPPPREALQWFVNREREREHFGNMLAGDDTTTRVLAVSGPEGIGKTWLRKRLYAEARKQQVPAFAFDFDPGEAFDELSLLQQAALALGGRQFPRLWGMLEEAAVQQVLIKVDVGATSSGGLTVHGDVEIQQVVEGPAFEGNTFIFPEKTPEEWELWWKRWQPRISEAFFQDLAVLGQTSGAALLFDRYESAPDGAQDWIKKKLLQRVCEDGLGYVWVVLVGEELPNLSAEWGGMVTELTLDPWSAAVVREYLPIRCVTISEPGVPAPDPQQLTPDASCQEYVIISEESVSVIFRVTGGRPHQIALLADFRQELREPLDEAQVQEILARGILTKTTGPVREALRRVAPAEWFDVDLLAALIEAPQEAAIERLDELCAYSFVQPGARGRHHLATRARQVLLNSWDRQPQQLAELHALLASHLEERAAAEQDPQLRHDLSRQAMAHWFVADENVGRQRLCALFEAAEQGYWLSECDLLIKQAETAPDPSVLTQTWLEYLRGRLALARDDRDTSLEKFDDVKDSVGTGSELYALAQWSRGQIAAESGNWERATRRYEDSLQTFTARKDAARQGQVMLSLGAVHLSQARALGASLQPRLLEAAGGRSWLRAAAAPLVGLGFLIYALTNRRWRLPAARYVMSYTNWTLARLLLTAQQWFTTAEARLTSAGKKDLLPDVQRQLAQTYHLLGWERDAQSLFQQLLISKPVSTSAYRKAQVNRDRAESDLSEGHTGDAISRLKESLQTFEGHEDRQAQAEVNALLGRAYLEKGKKGDFEQGLMLLRTSLAEFARLKDQGVGAGLALHALRGWLERSRPTPEQADKARAVLAETEEEIYFPRVADRAAQKVEALASAGLLLLLVVGLPILMAVIILTPVNEWAHAHIVLRFALWLLLALGILVIILGGLGFVLIKRGARRSQRPEPLDRIVTGPDSIRRVDHTGEREEPIRWEEIQAVVSVDRVLWRAPLTLLSHFQIFGHQAILRLPATMRWYSALRQDVEDHLRERGAQPTRLPLDARLPLIPTLLVSLVLLIVGALMVYAVIPLLSPLDLSAWLGTTLMFLGVMGLLLGSSWWLVIHPLLVRYHLEPRSWRWPLAAGLTGLGIVAVGGWLRWQHPFHPLRNWLEWTAFPVGYLLLLAACLWVLTARLRPVLGAQRSGPAYPLWLRAIILPVLLTVAGLTGLFVRSEWLPYLPLFRALVYYQGEAYEDTIQSAEEALEINPNIADGYYLRAMASKASDDPQTAVDDLTYVIELDTESMVMYTYYRAQAYQALGETQAACTDLRKALDARRWGLSAEKRKLAEEYWDDWECSSIPEQGKE